MPKISIIVPVYNVEKYLSKCLDSLCGQTYKNLEIICVNGGSTDQSGRILNEYMEKDNRIIVITVGNEGVSVSRNAGLDFATGKYIMFVDSDDWIEEKTCEIAQVEAEKENADVVIWTYMREFLDYSLPKKIFNERIVFENDEDIEKIHRRFVGLVGDELKEVENADSLCTVWGKLYRRDIIEKNRTRFTDIKEIGTYEDGLFNLYIFKNIKKAVYINEYLYHYRRDNINSITSMYKPYLFQQWKNLFKYMENYIKENQLPVVYQEALRNRICLSVLGLSFNIWESKHRCIHKIKDILSDELYRKAFREFSGKDLPVHWRMFYGCAKIECAIGVYILIFCIQKIRGK